MLRNKELIVMGPQITVSDFLEGLPLSVLRYCTTTILLVVVGMNLDSYHGNFCYRSQCSNPSHTGGASSWNDGREKEWRGQLVFASLPLCVVSSGSREVSKRS